MSNSLLFLPDLCYFFCNLISNELNLDAIMLHVLHKLLLMKTRRVMAALITIALILGVLIVTIIVKFYIGLN